MNLNAKPWYPKGLNPNAPEYIPGHYALKTILKRIIPSQQTIQHLHRGAIGSTPTEPFWNISPISPTTVLYYNTKIKP